MTNKELTESLTLALKLKAEVERVCTLLDEKDARIAELERTIAVQRETAAIGSGDPLVDPQARIAALESELAAKGRFLVVSNGATQHFKEDRDRERSRREALEREVRRGIDVWEHKANDLASIGEWTHATGIRVIVEQLRAILDRSAEQDAPRPEPRRDYPPRTQPKPWFGDENRGRNYFYASDVVPLHEKPVVGFNEKPAAADEPHTPDAEPIDPPCCECGGPTRLIKYTLTHVVCGDCYERLYLPKPAAPEPRMSVSEAHLRELRAKVWDEAAELYRRTANWLEATTLQAFEDRAAAVRRGEG